MTTQTLNEIAEQLIWKGERAKQIGRLADDDEYNDFLINQRLDEEWDIHQYTHR